MGEIVKKLDTGFAMKDLGPLSFFLCIEIQQLHTPLPYKYGLQEAIINAVDPSIFRSTVGSLQYVNGTIDHGLRIISQSSFRLYGFSDAYWAGCATTRSSTTRYSAYLGANFVSWSSRKQDTVERSSVEAEYTVLAATTTELTWICYILQDIGVYIQAAPTLFHDNLSGLYMTTNPVMLPEPNM
ncbi:uncharacterized mitochondrial protein AtMg00810-like [Capsicum annuum]|uniref:uncharacterized mitochondrial protein AtMg00810-like n=1 Tax=Capsicum annuum TaxID=4072 RepID=UPI0007BFCB8F|nr:uncharacterized mitochondrial protein AtMg00810-like [Capsicum annuum]